MRVSCGAAALLLCASMLSFEAGALVPSAPSVLNPRLSTRSACSSKPSSFSSPQVAAKGTQLRMMGDKSNPGGDEEGKPHNSGPIKGGANSTAPHGFIPAEVSASQLHYLALQFQLKQAVLDENYDDAAKLKMEIDSLDHQETQAVIKKLLKETKKMHDTISKTKARSEVEKLEMDLQDAILDEDYVNAKEIAAKLGTLKGKSNGGKRLPILRQIDMVWLESEIGSRVAEARSKEEDRLQDPVAGLENELRNALEDENFEQAARLRDRLDSLHLRRDVMKMNRDLTRQISFKKAEIERLRKNPEKLLNHKLHDAVNAEDFEQAKDLAKQIKEVELRKMYETLSRKLRDRLAEESRKTESGALDDALEQSIAEEDFQKAREIQAVLNKDDEFVDLREGLELAEKEGRFEEAHAFKSALIDKYIQFLGTPLLQAMGYQCKPPTFRVGQPVYHKQLGFRGVVIGWHDTCRASEPWIQHHGVDQMPSGREQRFYHVLAPAPCSSTFHQVLLAEPDYWFARQVLPDTRDVALSKSEGKALWIGQCGPAFLTGKNPADKLPFLQTCYLAEDAIEPWTLADTTGVLASVMQPIKTIFTGGSPVQHPLIPHYFVSFRAGRYRADRKINSIVHYHMPEWSDKCRNLPDDKSKAD